MFTKLSVCVVLFLILALKNDCNGQVYNYLPVSYSNIETNPTFVSSKANQLLISASHINNFQKKEQFSYSSFRVSNYFEKYFTGVGITINRTTQNDSLSYNHVGLIASYRNVLFNSVQVKVGINYKFLNVNSTNGQFTRYDFEPQDSVITVRQTQNINLAFTLSLRDQVYVTYGVMNLTPTWVSSSESKTIFPEYQYLKFGDLFTLLGIGRNRELSFLILGERLLRTGSNNSYLITVHNRYLLSRKSLFRYGGDFGYNDLGYFQIRPTISYYYRLRNSKNRWKRRFLIVKTFADLALPSTNSFKPYKPSYSLSLKFNL